MPLSDLSNPDVLLRENWQSHLAHGVDGTPHLPPSFVAELGPRVWLVDVREDEELVGPAGHIPGIARLPLARVGEVASLLPTYARVILVCSDGERSSTAARFLLGLGMTTVAAMAGGMRAWRTKGYSVSRGEAVLQRTLTAPAPGHGSDGRLLESSGQSGHLTRDAIESHLGESAKVRKVKLAAFLLASQTSCVDGREDRAIIGTPGGDAGELMLGLAAVEELTQHKVDTGKVAEITRAFADTFGGIYLHTDNHALNRLARSLQSDKRLEAHVTGLHTVQEWERFLRHPPGHLQEPLLEHLVQPAHVGCGHLKLALTRPQDYQLRPELITAFFQSFYRELWRGADDLAWVVLGGHHSEGAVVNVTVEGELRPFSDVPMIAPSVAGTQMFVNHPQVVTYLREQTAHFFVTRGGPLMPQSVDHEKLGATIVELGGVQAGATLSALAAGLPTFGVHFGYGDKVSVTQGESIPKGS